MMGERYDLILAFHKYISFLLLISMRIYFLFLFIYHLSYMMISFIFYQIYISFTSSFFLLHWSSTINNESCCNIHFLYPAHHQLPLEFKILDQEFSRMICIRGYRVSYGSFSLFIVTNHFPFSPSVKPLHMLFHFPQNLLAFLNQILI